MLWVRAIPTDNEIAEKLDYMLEQYPYKCTPFGYWRPDSLLQSIVMPEVTRAQQTWMLVGARKGLPRHVSLLVAAYVCTKGDEWL